MLISKLKPNKNINCNYKFCMQKIHFISISVLRVVLLDKKIVLMNIIVDLVYKYRRTNSEIQKVSLNETVMYTIQIKLKKLDAYVYAELY